MNRLLSLGIDTSNYKTSVAIVDAEGNILFNHQKLLEVKSGERGLRQSEALFQHVQRLPGVLEKVLADKSIRRSIAAVAVSSRPRPVEGSYMPVFTAGIGYARAVAAALGVPFYEFSHQEGHIEAVKHYSDMYDAGRFVCFHFSGGTTEAIYVDNDRNIFEIVGGSKDLAYGQVLDRLGVALGYEFPCGAALDEIAVSLHTQGAKPDKSLLTKIKVSNAYVNLSGIETQCQRLVGNVSKEELINAVFFRLSESVAEMTRQLSEKYNLRAFLYAGGVSCSSYMRKYLESSFDNSIEPVFGSPEMSSDNAVGTALLGGKKIWL
ncbi:MAG: O-sialoglycoprotein endopeptidase [Firmicutes bacterium]|nr:O-sialoglycoprotein endopeptidase [Bacillota bacterium]